MIRHVAWILLSLIIGAGIEVGLFALDAFGNIRLPIIKIVSQKIIGALTWGQTSDIIFIICGIWGIISFGVYLVILGVSLVSRKIG